MTELLSFPESARTSVYEMIHHLNAVTFGHRPFPRADGRTKFCQELLALLKAVGEAHSKVTTAPEAPGCGKIISAKQAFLDERDEDGNLRRPGLRAYVAGKRPAKEKITHKEWVKGQQSERSRLCEKGAQTTTRGFEFGVTFDNSFENLPERKPQHAIPMCNVRSSASCTSDSPGSSPIFLFAFSQTVQARSRA